MSAPALAPRSGFYPPPPNPSCCRSTGGCGCLAGPPANTYPRNKPSKQTATTPPLKTKNPSCRHSVAACVSDHSRGQALPPATPLKTNGNNTPTIVIPESPPPGGASHRSCGYAVAKRLHGREAGSPPSASARPASRSPESARARIPPNALARAPSVQPRTGAQEKRFSTRPSAFGGFGRIRRGCASAPPSAGAARRDSVAVAFGGAHGRLRLC